MASDLIYREDAKDFVRYAYRKGLNPVEYLDEVPAADVRPVIHASWERTEKNDPESNVICTHCKEQFSYIDGVCYLVCGYRLPHFCPNCGADMRPREEVDDDKTDAD